MDSLDKNNELNKDLNDENGSYAAAGGRINQGEATFTAPTNQKKGNTGENIIGPVSAVLGAGSLYVGYFASAVLASVLGLFGLVLGLLGFVRAKNMRGANKIASILGFALSSLGLILAIVRIVQVM